MNDGYTVVKLLCHESMRNWPALATDYLRSVWEKVSGESWGGFFR